MKYRWTLLPFALGLAFVSPLAPPSAAADAISAQQDFGAWHMRCREIIEGEQACALHQRLVSETTGKHVMAMALAGNREGNGYRLSVVLPLGLDVPAGITGRIGNGPEFSYQLQTCISRGCIANVTLNPDEVSALAAAGSLTTRFQLRGVAEPVAVAASLNGLAEGIKAMASR